MAVFYEGIKGCDAGLAYSYLVWTNTAWQVKLYGSNTIKKSFSDIDSATYYGYFLTSNETHKEQTVEWLEFQAVANKGLFKVKNSSYSNVFDYDSYNGAGRLIYDGLFRIQTLVVQNGLTANGDLLAKNNCIIDRTLTCVGNATFQQNISVIYKAEAQYFNSTSDIRSKTNINKSDFSALQIVQQLPIYNFNYKSTGAPSIGIMAQDAQDIKIADFEIVDNKEATGENNDFMTIKESKLVYILWKAVQEQQAKIKELEEKIKALS